MKKIVPHILFFLLTFSAFSQGVFFNLGKNFSSYSYRNRSSFSEKIKINGIGDVYELGYTAPLKYKNLKALKYSASLTLNEYNGIGESSANKLSYTTAYLGVQSTIDYQFYDSFYFFLSARAGLNIATILRGKQEVDNSVYNLVHQGEFSGIVLRPVVGVYAKYYLSKSGYLSAGLNLSKGVKIGTNSDNVSINNSQIVFGGYFDLIKR